MDLTISQRSTRPGAIDDQEPAAGLLDTAIRRAWATSEPRLLIAQVGPPEAQRKLLEQLHVHAQAAGAWALDAEANVVGLDGPYAPIVRALTSLAPRVATEPGSLGTSIRHRLQQTAGPLGRLLVGLCPAFGQLVGTSSELEDLPCGFALERFETLLVRVFAALAPAERPMVFFLREADEADPATLRILSRILAHTETRQFVLVALVGPRSKRQANDAWTAFSTTRRHVVERFEIATSHIDDADQEPISGTFVTQLPPETRHAVMAAACSGQTAEADAIAAALELSAQAIHELLRPALEAGLLSRKGSSYSFTDARAARTWHDSMNARTAGAMHLRLARWLAQKTLGKIDRELRFVSSAHLQHAVDGGVTDGLEASERARLAEVMVNAANQAQQVAAYDVANEILTRAALLMAPDGDVWSVALPDLARRLEFTRFDCACALGNRSRAEELLTSLRVHAGQAAEMPAAERTMIDLLARLGEFAAAVAHAARLLAPLGIHLEPAPSRQTLDLAFDSVWEALGDRAIEEITELDRMTNPQALAATEMLFAVHPSAQALGGGAADLVACHLARLGLLHGNADASSVGYAAFGAAIIGRKKDHRTGYRFGKVATNLCEQRGTHRHHTAVSMKFAAAMSIWTHPLQTSLEQCTRTYETAMLCGDARAAGRLAAMIALLRLLEGAPLDEVGEEALRRRRAISSHQFDDEGMGELCDAIERFVGHQKGRTAQRKTVHDATGPLRLGQMACRVLDLMTHVLGHEYDDALTESAALRPIFQNVGAQLIVPEFLFWGTLAATLPRSSGCPEGLDEVIDDFERWADRCPQTFQHKHALLVAERCRLQGLDLDAMRAYDQAITEARENGFTYLEAVAAEAATRFYSGRDFAMIATTYFRASRNAYARWGAPHKVMQLDRRFPKLSGNTELASTPPPAMRGSHDVDLFTAVRTAQSVSKEIVLQRLLVTLMRIVLEHGGAERCHVLLEHDDGELNHAGKAVTTTKGVDLEVPGPVAKYLGDILPASILEHVRRTRESVNIDDATTDREWADDPYIANTRPRSILCFPIVRQSELVGMFYLENNSARGAFTPRRLALLEFLATQASISLEHAKLYADLARENAERSRAEQVLRKSEQTLRDKLEIIERQKNDIRTLSTPLLDVADHIVAMPILGELDEERASRIMDILLDTITKRSVHCAILDLTGVSSIGEATAEQIGRIVRAVELVGARAIVAGIRADVARAIISLDIGLGHVETRASMKDALRQVQGNGAARRASR